MQFGDQHYSVIEGYSKVNNATVEFNDTIRWSALQYLWKVHSDDQHYSESERVINTTD
jgi:hypothetical protein